MYKVFTENGWIVFTKNWKKQFKLENTEVIYDIDFNSEQQFKIREKTPLSKTLLVLSANPKRSFFHTFKSYDFIQAAGGIVIRKNKFLFIERHGKWDIPKGKRDKGESIKKCAVREIEEECGISDLHLVSKLLKTYHTYAWDGKPTLKETHWFELSYNGTKKLIPQEEEAITQALWLNENDFKRVRSNTFETIQLVLDKFQSKK